MQPSLLYRQVYYVYIPLSSVNCCSQLVAGIELGLVIEVSGSKWATCEEISRVRASTTIKRQVDTTLDE